MITVSVLSAFIGVVAVALSATQPRFFMALAVGSRGLSCVTRDTRVLVGDTWGHLCEGSPFLRVPFSVISECALRNCLVKPSAAARLHAGVFRLIAVSPSSR